jgi:signal transduction histidine kinase/HD-like signal output (HDOD) protein
MQDQSRQRLELILRQVDSLPTLPMVAMQVLQVASSESTSAKDVCRTIEADPALSARILRLVHRADVGVSGEVTSLDRAVKLLGFDAVRCAVLAVSVFATYGPIKSAAEESFAVNYWKHSIAVASCAELLAVELVANWGRDAGVQPGEAFLAGLLHDIGKLALDMTVPKSFAKVVEAVDLLRGNIADVERSVIGVDHQVVGKRLAELWQLPTVLRDAIWLHGQLPQALPSSVRNARLVNLVTLADMLVREQHLGYSGNYQYPVARDTLTSALGLLPQQLDNVQNGLIAAIESRAKTIGLTTGDKADLYRCALQEANRELSRVSDQLASRNRRLSIRAKYFEAIAAFQTELRPDAPPATVLTAIAQTAAAVLESDTVAAFSLPPGAGYAEVSLADVNGQVLHSQLIDSYGAAAVPVPSNKLQTNQTDGPVSIVGPDLEWLVSGFSPKLAGTRRFWIALESDGQCVGGVIWGGHPDEGQRLSPQAQELVALSAGWSLALRTCQIRDESRALAEQLAEANRRLQSAQSEIYRTRMLTSVAQIAAGAAHEMNNPLMVISGRSQLLASTLPSEKERESAKLIYEKSEELSGLITALMHFAKPQPPQPAPTEVPTLYRTALEKAKLRVEFGNRQIETRLSDLPPANVDPEQLSEALSEIIINAIEATDANAGRITLSGSHDAFGQRLVLTIADNGRGMDEETRSHAFDPFFSAKAAGRQQGMGLAKAQRWAESSQGSIRLESQPGSGSRIILILPAGVATSAQPLRPARTGSI